MREEYPWCKERSEPIPSPGTYGRIQGGEILKVLQKRMSWIVVLLGLLFVTGALGLKDDVEVRAVQDQTYEKLQIFTDVLKKLKENYVEEVNTQDLIYGAIKGMLETLDPHSSFLPPDVYKELQVETKGSFGGLGIEITIRDGILTIVSPIEDTPAFEAGLKAGDRIVMINDEPTKDMTLFEAVKKMRGKKGTKITLKIVREGLEEPLEVTMTRAVIKIKSVKSELLDKEFGYVRITQFQEDTDRELKKALKRLKEECPSGLKGLILDLRNNPGGLLDQAVSVSDEFLDSGKIVYTDGRVKSQKMEFYAHPQQEHYDFPIIVLVNGGSASASEIVAGALQDHQRAVILGTQTFGKGSVQTIIPLDDGSGLKLTTAQYFTPSGRVIQAEGIKPDIVVSNVIPEKNGKPIRFLREKDLKRHLEMGESGGEEGQGKDSDAIKEDGGSEKEADGGDNQLDHALDLLKSWNIFKQIENHGSSVAMESSAR